MKWRNMIMYDINFPIILPRMIKDAEIPYQYNEQQPLDNVAKIMETVIYIIYVACPVGNSHWKHIQRMYRCMHTQCKPQTSMYTLYRTEHRQHTYP